VYSGNFSSRRGWEWMACSDSKTMATPNYSFEKRRRELDKKAKKEEKRKRKLEGGSAPAEDAAEPAEPAGDAEPLPAGDAPAAPEA